MTRADRERLFHWLVARFQFDADLNRSYPMSRDRLPVGLRQFGHDNVQDLLRDALCLKEDND